MTKPILYFNHESSHCSSIAPVLGRIRSQPGWRAPYDLLHASPPLLAGTRT
jgi:hypothetical protein